MYWSGIASTGKTLGWGLLARARRCKAAAPATLGHPRAISALPRLFPVASTPRCEHVTLSEPDLVIRCACVIITVTWCVVQKYGVYFELKIEGDKINKRCECFFGKKQRWPCWGGGGERPWDRLREHEERPYCFEPALCRFVFFIFFYLGVKKLSEKYFFLFQSLGIVQKNYFE